MSNLNLFYSVHLLPVTLGVAGLNASENNFALYFYVKMHIHIPTDIIFALPFAVRCQGNKVNSRTSCAVKRMYGKRLHVDCILNMLIGFDQKSYSEGIAVLFYSMFFSCCIRLSLMIPSMQNLYIT